MLLRKLATEKYLEHQNTTIKTIAQARTIDFENHQKRVVDIVNEENKIHPITIQYLKPNAKKNFWENNWAITL